MQQREMALLWNDLQLCAHMRPHRVQDGFPLHASILRRDTAAVRAALHKGIVFAEQDAHGNPPLHCAVASGDPELVQMLLDGGANVALRNLAGNTPLESAFALVCPPRAPHVRERCFYFHHVYRLYHGHLPAASPPCRTFRMSRASSRRAAPR